MKKRLVFITVLLFVLMASFSTQFTCSMYAEDMISANRERGERIFAKEYEISSQVFTDRVDENGPMEIRSFIRPEETESYLSSLGITADMEMKDKINIIYKAVMKDFEFVPDEEGEDLWQMPSETIKRGKGDCEDLSFLLASILIRAGVPEDLIRVNFKDWHAYTTVIVDGKILVFETDQKNHYSYEWPQITFNRSHIQRRVKN